MNLRFLTVLAGLLCIPALGLAAVSAGSEFSISVFTGEDAVPPTTPTSTAAVPVAPSQIDVSWAAASDNVFLIGYTVARDGVVIATTSQTNFSDTGLAPTTTYTYTIRAFDQARNYSSSSSPVATTTLAPPPPPPTPTSTTATEIPDDPTQGTIVRLQLSDFSLTASTTSARIRWQTNTASRYALRWGRGDAYELGYILDDVYRRGHENTITDLEPGTEYAFELIGITVGGAETVLQRGTFTSASDEPSASVPNVRRLSASVSGDDVLLRWENPDPERFAYVRVVRSPYRIPLDLRSGALVYQGRGERVRDRGALTEYSPQYYTVFVVDASERISSGAVTWAERSGTPGTAPAPPRPREPVLPPQSVPPYTSEVFAASGTPLLPLSAITVEQDRLTQQFADPVIELLATKPFTVRVAASSTARSVQSLVATILDPTDHRRQYSFLLRLNADRTAYAATVAPLGLIGTSRLEVAVYDFSAQLVSQYRHQIDFIPETVTSSVFFPDALVPVALPLSIAVFLAAGFILVLVRRRRHDA